MSTNLKPGRLDSSKDFSAFVPSAFQAANLAFLQANAAFTVANSGSGAASSGLYANAAFLQANSAFTRANNSLNITTGGTVAGDVIITGNLTIQGERTYANTQTVLIADNIITVNAAIDQASAPVFNAGIEVDRGSSANTALLWNESTDKWTATNDGTNYFNLASDAAESYANAAFLQANTGVTNAATADSKAVTSGSYANAAFLQANTAATNATSAGLYANAAFLAANNSTDTWVRGAANAASSYANSAYTQANTATTNAATADSKAVTAGSYANSAFTAANTAATNATSAGSYANAAFTKANTGGGSGLFNSAINVSTGYAVTSALANAVVFTANATVHSIYITNIGADVNAAVTITGDFTPAGSSANVSLFRNIPIPSRSSVEMLKKPQVVRTNDIIKMQSFFNGVAASSNVHATIVYETTALSTFDRSAALAGTGYSTLYTATGSPAVIESIKVVNQDTAFGNHAISIIWTNSGNTIQGYMAKEIILPANSTIELCEAPKYLSTGDKLDIFSSFANVVSVFVSAKRTS